MRILRLVRGFAFVALLGATAGCTSVNPALYVIAPVPGPVVDSAPKAIDLQQIGLARYLERSEIVRSSENYRLDVMTNDWWGEPLGAMLGRVLATELGQRLPASTVYTETGAVAISPDATVAVQILRLDEDLRGVLVLQAQAAVTFAHERRPRARGFRFEVTPPAPGTPGEVAAISTAVGRLADALTLMLTEPRGT
jgi:uncharacterized protein